MSDFKTFDIIELVKDAKGPIKGEYGTYKRIGVKKQTRILQEHADALNEQYENSLELYEEAQPKEEKDKTVKESKSGDDKKALSQMNKTELLEEVDDREGLVVAENATNKEIAEAIRTFDKTTPKKEVPEEPTKEQLEARIEELEGKEEELTDEEGKELAELKAKIEK